MKKLGVGLGVFVGLILVAPLVGLMYLGQQLLKLPFLPFELFDWITRVLPGQVITFGIDLMIDSLRLLKINVADTAKTAEQASAVLGFLAAGTLFGALYLILMKTGKNEATPLSGVIAGALFGLPLIAISVAIGQPTVGPLLRILWIAALFLGWGILLSWITRRLMPSARKGSAEDAEPSSAERIGRRQFLITLGASSATITLVGAGVGSFLARRERQRLQQELDDSMAHLAEGPDEPSFPNANDPVTPAPGTRPEYTPVKDHYKVFIRTEPTVIDESEWRLPVTGMVDNPLMLTLDDLQSNFPSRDQFVTLSCISGRIGTSLISTTMWTGVSLKDLLEEAQVQGGARYLHITSGDGFYETVDLGLINSDERIMLCYAWDGNQLPVDHGFPLRIWIPDRYGMKQPKWITGIEVVGEYTEGYWVERGWDEEARVRTTSVIDTVAVDAILDEGDERYVPIGGIAFSGARGISKVEVRVDGGPWQETQRRSPLSETTWVIWRYEWPFSEGEHTFEVRCAEEDGTPQIEEEMEARPSGATGVHSVDAAP